MLLGKGDLRGFNVRVNIQSPILQVSVAVQHVKPPIRGIPKQLRQILPLLSHIRSYPPRHSAPYLLSFSSSFTTLPSSQNTKFSHPSLSLHALIISWHRVQYTPSTACTEWIIHRVQHTLSTAYTKYSTHRVQHTPSTAYTDNSIHRVQHTLSTVFTQYSISPR